MARSFPRMRWKRSSERLAALRASAAHCMTTPRRTGSQPPGRPLRSSPLWLRFPRRIAFGLLRARDDPQGRALLDAKLDWLEANLAADRLKRRAVRRIQSTMLRDRLKAVGQSDNCFGRAEHQEGVLLHCPRKALKHADFGHLVEIDEHIAAEHRIERAKLTEIPEQSGRKSTIARIARAICQLSPIWVKY